MDPVATAEGAVDPAGGLCGLTGSLPNLRLPGKGYNELYLGNNQLTGQLPADLLAWANRIKLHNNKFSGSVPGISAGFKGRVTDLSG